MLLEQLYCKYHNIKPKTAPKGVIIMCFHPCKQKSMIFKIGFIGLVLMSTSSLCSSTLKYIVVDKGVTMLVSITTIQKSCFPSFL